MSLDEKYMRDGVYDVRRNPIAAQLLSAFRASPSMTTDANGKLENPDETIETLWTAVGALERAVALLEDQISELRGRPADPRENLLHHSEEIDAQILNSGPQTEPPRTAASDQ